MNYKKCYGRVHSLSIVWVEEISRMLSTQDFGLKFEDVNKSEHLNLYKMFEGSRTCLSRERDKAYATPGVMLALHIMGREGISGDTLS